MSNLINVVNQIILMQYQDSFWVPLKEEMKPSFISVDLFCQQFILKMLHLYSLKGSIVAELLH